MSHPNRGPDAARRVDGIDWKQDNRAAARSTKFDADVWHKTSSLTWAQEVHQDGGASAAHKKLAATHDLITGSDGKSYFHRSALDGVYRKMALTQ